MPIKICLLPVTSLALRYKVPVDKYVYTVI